MGLFDDFLALAPAASGTEMPAVPLAGRRSDFLAKSTEGAPVFLLQDTGTATYTPGVSLRHLSVQFHATCRVHVPSGPFDGQFAVLACDVAAPELYELFVRCVSVAVEALPPSAETMDIEACIRSLTKLFRGMSAPGGREIAGLWAELFIIAQSSDVGTAVRAWHADKFERFDFSWPGGVLEVKATQGTARVHEFALEQLATPSTGNGLVASLLLQPLTNGVGVMDLATRIDAGLHTESDLRQRLWSNIAAALGAEFSEKLDRRYDLSFAERHIAMFNMADIPAPERPSDPRVTGIRFRSDLTTVASSVTGSVLKVLREVLSS